MESSTSNMLTVTQASVALGVHPTQVRLLARRGELRGERLGTQWVIPRTEIERYAARPNLAGRLFSQRIAWSVIASLEGVTPPWALTREERARVRNYAERPLRDLSARLGGRGGTERLSVGPGGLERLDGGPSWIRGATARSEARTVAYTTESSLERFLEGSNAVSDTEQPNLILRVVADRWWPFPAASGGEEAWSTVLELDRFDAREVGPSGEEALLASAVALP
jgi:excisionase family DNA binding protein